MGTDQCVGTQSALTAAVIDACVLSRGQGLAGTIYSTYSIYAGLRVEAWQDGIWLDVGKEWWEDDAPAEQAVPTAAVSS